jgi:excisionase family DNA binding protein
VRETRHRPGLSLRVSEGLPSEPLLSLAEVAQFLHLSAKSVQRLVSRGSLPCYRIGRLVRFSAGDVFRWLEARKEG